MGATDVRGASMADYDMTARSNVGRYLEPGEKLLWAGRPASGIKLRASDILLIPFSLLWAGFAIFWEVGVINSNAPLFFRLWGIPFVLVGLYIVAGRFFHDAWRRDKTLYGLTDRRAVIVSGILSRRISSIFLDNLADLTLSERANGEGSIQLGRPVPSYWRWNGGWWSGGADEGHSFEFIPDAAQVYRMIQKAKSEMPRPAE